MERFLVEGVDQQSGQESSVVLEASNAAMAKAKGEVAGLKVVQVGPVPPTRLEAARARRRQAVASRRRRSSGLLLGMGLSGAVIVVITLAVVFDSHISPRASSLPGTAIPSNRVPEIRWHEGGTLHDATMKQWSQADERDRLATAADFAAIAIVAEYGTTASLEELKPVATTLADGISAANQAGKVDDVPVRDVAAIAWDLVASHAKPK